MTKDVTKMNYRLAETQSLTKKTKVERAIHRESTWARKFNELPFTSIENQRM